jgi:hypothetical protein
MPKGRHAGSVVEMPEHLINVMHGTELDELERLSIQARANLPKEYWRTELATDQNCYDSLKGCRRCQQYSRDNSIKESLLPAHRYDSTSNSC